MNSCRSSEQLVKLLDFMSEDGVMVDGKLSFSRQGKQDFWDRVTAQLNAMEGGGQKTALQWGKVWTDWKDLTKRKVKILQKMRNNIECGTTAKPLTTLEQRLLKLIGYPRLDLQPITKVEAREESMDDFIGYLDDDFLESSSGLQIDTNDNVNSSENHNLTVDVKGETVVAFDPEHSNFSTEQIEEASGSSEDSFKPGRKKRKMMGKKMKKKKRTRLSDSVPEITLAEYKAKASLALEKEKIQQKREELRLRALELKLKGDELKLMEMEMNKLNHLTNIEEEKLTCYKEMSAMLKELVERSRTGTWRFSNV